MDDAIRVLYVDAEPDTAETAAATLEREDSTLTVETATSASDALCRLPGEVDCVVAVQDLAEMSGFELLEAVREGHPDLPFVLVSDTGSEVASAAVAAGVPESATEEEETLLAARIRAAVDDPPVELDQSERLPLSEAFPDLAFYIDEDGRYLDFITGMDSPLLYDDVENLLGKRLDDVLPATLADRFQDVIERALDTGDVQTIQYQLDVQAGSRWFEARVAPVETARAGRRQTLCVARDITEQKEHATALKTLHEMATSIQTAETVERACELTVTAAAGVLEFEMCSVILREGDWLVPTAISEDAPPDGTRRMRVDEGLAGKTLQTGKSYVVDDVTTSNEAEPATDAYRSGLSVPIGEYGVFQAVGTEPSAFDQQDITLAELLVSHTRTALERLERERDLTRKTERLDEFASFVSHDLRNPLNVAMLRLELLADECNSDHLEGLEGALDRMERLIDELLTLARQGERIGDTEPIQLIESARQAWSNVETGSALLEDRTERVIYADRNRLAAVFENLFRNSVEHGGDGVTVTVGELEDERGFYVADDGPGIPGEERDRIFESGYSTAADGTGFGLTIVRDIVEAHGWTIRVTESDRGGARFEITDVEFAE